MAKFTVVQYLASLEFPYYAFTFFHLQLFWAQFQQRNGSVGLDLVRADTLPAGKPTFVTIMGPKK